MAPLESAKIMYEIYREEGYDRRFRVVYFTELGDRNKETEINRALAGTHVHDGFISERRKERTKEVIASFLARWNDGEDPIPDALETALSAVEALEPSPIIGRVPGTPAGR
jgi:hypothetical protein